MNRFNEACRQLEQWVFQAIDFGWLEEEAKTVLEDIDQVTADKLFTIEKRPLLVAFFGGTGVGKSSLLNRLARESIANVGAIRPTSHHVTLFLHEDYKNSLQEDALPTEGTRIVYHKDDSKRYFAWIDMPDIDSTEQHNREIVTNWLPVVDWLVYVVTPERYQDEKGWEFVQARGGKHNWLFVINHWDQGKNNQREDFTQKLIEQGFKEPVVLTTNCNPEQQVSDDQFHQLEEILENALKESGLTELQDLANKRQWFFMRKVIKTLVNKLEAPSLWKYLQEEWKTLSKKGLNELRQRLITNAQIIHQHWKIQEEQNKANVPGLNATDENSDDGTRLNKVFDLRSRTLLQTLKFSLENRFTASRFSTKIVNDKLNVAITDSEMSFIESIEVNFIKAIRQPGNVLTRLLRKVVQLLQWVLPLGMALWVGYHVVSGFNQGLKGDNEFLGLNFVTHSLLMIGLAWLIPWLVQKQFRPSYASAALQAVNKGIDSGAQFSKELLQQTWDNVEKEKNHQLEMLMQLQRNYNVELAAANKLPEKYMAINTKGVD